MPIPTVAILLCTYNGQNYLAQQLDSLATQTHSNWKLHVSDDGSQDATLSLLETYQSQWGRNRLKIYEGPKQGFATNFLSLLGKHEINANFYAYSDQDDIWEANKLARATNWLQTIGNEIPALYCSRTRLIDKNNKDIGFSPLFTKPASFANALVQNIGGGNTMVFNQAARDLIKEVGIVDVCTHDWWTYIVITGCGGTVFYDPSPNLRYRQHAGNLCGSNQGWLARAVRIRMLWQGQFRSWNNQNIQALKKIQHKLTPNHKITLARFSEARQKPFLPRIYGLKQSGIYRQTLLGNLGLLFGAATKRI